LFLITLQQYFKFVNFCTFAEENQRLNIDESKEIIVICFFMEERKKVMGKTEMEKTLFSLSQEVLEKMGEKDLAIIGIRKRGAILAKRIAERIKTLGKKEIPLGALDITLYRDDLSVIAPQPVVHQTEIPFNLTGKNILLVDDVLYTGRTVRAALDELIDFGRPREIKLLVLVDRGHRELPIQPDFVGKKVTAGENEMVEVKLKESDQIEEVLIIERKQ